MAFNNNFNFTRVLAALFVIISHSYEVCGNIESEPLLILTNGHLSFSAVGLYIFFFISGLLVTKSAFNSNNWHSFLIKRVLRIYPALIVLILLTALVMGPLFSKLSINEYFNSQKTWSYLITASGLKILFFLPGLFEEGYQKSVNASLWTISLELKLYFILGLFLVFNLFRNKTFYFIICLFIVTICLGTFFIDMMKAPPTFQPSSMRLICMFFIGSLFSVIPIQKKIVLLISLLGFLLITLKACKLYILPIPLGELLFFSSLTYFIGYSAPFLKLKSDISYGLYLIAFPIQQIVFLFSGFQQHPLVNTVVVLILSAAYAFWSWHYIEKPCLALKRKL